MNNLRRNDYYPYGLEHKGYNNVTTSTNIGQQFTFNGQQFDESLGLKVQEMTFRQYDPTIGRFNCIDRLAILVPSITPYRFGYNNPVFWSDPSGLIERSVLMDMFNRSGSGSTTWTNDGHSGFDTDDGGYVGYTSDDTTFNKSPGELTYLPAVTVNEYDEASYSRAGKEIEHNIYQTEWYNNSSKKEKSLLGKSISFDSEKYGFVENSGKLTTSYYLSTKLNRSKRKLAYEISKRTNYRSGALYQKGQKIARRGSKLFKKMRPAGTVLSIGTIGYEVGTDTWDAHTFVDGGLLLASGAATLFLASNPVGWAILTGVAIYGVADFTFGINDAIDDKIGRNSGIWD